MIFAYQIQLSSLISSTNDLPLALLAQENLCVSETENEHRIVAINNSYSSSTTDHKQ